jgi:uncharacterized Tic20 family protein
MEKSFSQSADVRYENVTSEERTTAILCHVLSIFFWIIPSLVIYLLKKDESAYVAEHAKEALNFQISLLIYSIVGIILIILLVGIFLLIAVYFASLILCIVAAVKASDNILYRYPFSIRLIK